MAIQMSNNLDLPPVVKSTPAQPSVASGAVASGISTPEPAAALGSTKFQLEYAFELPKGYLDSNGNLHRQGVMRLAKAMDEIVPMRDPRVRANPAYATVLILSRVITRLGTLSEVSPLVIEDLFACDLDYLQRFYRHINDLIP
ncbi:MAG: hypothetical protein VKI82_13615 [Leptolyngbya sp.]|nr:hypothetical protein [Leptolyngbya sp.]